MAIDPEKFDSLRQMLRVAIDFAPVDSAEKDVVENMLYSRLIGDLEPLIDESRPPRLYIFGRSGAGKSSLINALAQKQVADIGAVEPETVESTLYPIEFPEQHSSWQVVDSRGLFESIPADEEIPGGTVDAILADLKKYRPDILVHVLTPEQARAGKQDFEAVDELRRRLPYEFPSLVYCLNKIDTHAAPGQWPPEEYESVRRDIIDNLEFVAGSLLEEQDRRPFEPSSPLYGYLFDSDQHIGVFPTYLREEPYWNADTVSKLMYEHLPEEAKLQFAQAQSEQREELMRDIAKTQTENLSITAGLIAGADITGISDIAILTPLQVCLVILIGALSCEEFSTDTAKDYFGELGVVGTGGLLGRKLAGTIAGFIPAYGQYVNMTVAGTTTYILGRSAEHYFFEDEFIKPIKFKKEAESKISDSFD